MINQSHFNLHHLHPPPTSSAAQLTMRCRLLPLPLEVRTCHQVGMHTRKAGNWCHSGIYRSTGWRRVLAKCFQTTSYSSPVLQSSSQIHAGKIHHSLTTRTAPPNSPLFSHHLHPSPSPPTIPKRHRPDLHWERTPRGPTDSWRARCRGTRCRRATCWIRSRSSGPAGSRPRSLTTRWGTAGHGAARGMGSDGKWWKWEGSHRNITKCLVWNLFWMFENLRLLKVRNEMSWTSTGETQNWFGKMWEWPLS